MERNCEGQLVLAMAVAVADGYPKNSQIDEFSLIVFHLDGSCVVRFGELLLVVRGRRGFSEYEFWKCVFSTFFG